MIYKLLRGAEWAELKKNGEFLGTPLDRADGFIHLSSAAQVRETAAKHFAGASGLVLAEVDPARTTPAPVWEPSRGGRLFPHLYAPLPLSAVVRSWNIPLGPDLRHVFPEELP
jgi:uncharacterized protein (DUF952 family)